MITGHYFVGRVEAVAKPDFLECPVGFCSSTRPTGHYDNLSIRNGIRMNLSALSIRLTVLCLKLGHLSLCI